MSSSREGILARPVSPLDQAGPITESDRRADAFSRTVLTEDDSMYKDILEDFEHAGIAITKVERLSNPLLKKRYCLERDLVCDMRKNHEETFDPNERYLYHGTPGKKLEQICREGLDSRLAKNGCFGKGIYFSDHPEKCAKYAEKGSDDDYFILLIRVLLGESKVYAKGERDKALLREPVKNTETGDRYDSVEGFPRRHREFVVYETRRTLPEAIITYTRPNFTEKPDAVAEKECNTESGETTEDCADRDAESDYDDAQDFIDSTDSSTDDENDFKDAKSTDDEEVDSDKDHVSDDENDDPVDVGEDDGDDDVEYSDQDETDDEDEQKIKDSVNKKRKVAKARRSTRESVRDYALRLTREFQERTGVTQQYIIDHCLLKGNLEVERAVEIYTKMQDETQEDVEEPPVVIKNPVRPVRPQPNTEEWNNLSNEELETTKNGFMKDFLFITGYNLQDKDDVAKSFLEKSEYDLDRAIVDFYEDM